MKKQLINIVSFMFLLVGMSTIYTVQAQPRMNRTSDRQAINLVTSIETKTTAYKNIMNRGNRGGYNNNNNRNNEIVSFITDFETANRDLRQKLNSRQQISNADVETVLNRANFIENYMRNNRQSASNQSQWDSIKTDLNSLARIYNISWNWNNTVNNQNNGGYNQNNNSNNYSLTGTYQLNVSQSDDVRTAVDRALSNNRNNNSSNNSNQNDRMRQNLERRLASPETLMIENVNRQLTIGTSTMQPVTLTADGVARTEQNANGRSVSTKAVTTGNGVVISYEGDRMNDFNVTFMPSYNGQLKVTRRIYLENTNETITVSSLYDRTSPTANWSVVNNQNNGNYGNNNNGNYGNNGNYPTNNQNNGQYENSFVIPNGTKINALLTSQLSTKSSVDGDKFTMEVRSPSQYQGAIIEGHVSSPQSSGKITGRAELSLIFDRITLRNGRSYRYSGLIDSVRTSTGENININNEGAVQDSNQTTKTVTRAGIGAGLGAIIGAIAGGGSGAAIGAAIGGGAGAGSVVLQGRDNLELKSGTEINLTSSAPSNIRAN